MGRSRGEGELSKIASRVSIKHYSRDRGFGSDPQAVVDKKRRRRTENVETFVAKLQLALLFYQFLVADYTMPQMSWENNMRIAAPYEIFGSGIAFLFSFGPQKKIKTFLRNFSRWNR